MLIFLSPSDGERDAPTKKAVPKFRNSGSALQEPSVFLPKWKRACAALPMSIWPQAML
jgi:hypothetical protein